ncbi:mitochondrial carrier domain-containing protein [Radiomyces spectabilis]|uniref:mitochondrial carrier domain-containing protein n=1 Tax=Radiomyces spectabilis TaxID=64574 RepID=UPI002220F1E8|nr:mitochondrial carrier domain-containing protein [Radiomyces spectabilis]KAI8374489.1 mitochondrial carrier domain-containing protein [Radiomyces spectabilis]
MSENKQTVIPFEEYKLPPVAHAVSGAVGSTIANLFIYPLDIATTRLQLETSKTQSVKQHHKGLLSTLCSIYQKEGGIKGLYAGLGADTLATVLSSFIYFYCYSMLRNVQEKMNSSLGKAAQLNVAQELFLGAEAALISRLFTTPVSNISTRLQTTANKRLGFMDMVKDIFKEKGISGFWTGYRASMVLVVNPSITYFAFEKLRSFYLRMYKRSSLSSLEVFLFSALAKTVATMVTYPFILLRTTMVANTSKSDKKHDSSSPSKSMFSIMKQVVRTDGLSGLYRGMQAQIIKGFFNQGIMYMIKDYVGAYLAIIFYASYKLRMNRRLASA